MLRYKLILILLSVYGSADISSSSDLNCDFSSSCRWRNASGVEDNGDWIINTRYEVDTAPLIVPRKINEGFFAHTSGFMGRTVALLVSDVASCQLGGGSIKYWYFKTGAESQLELCTRQPPGSQDIHSLKCYDGLLSSSAQQWMFRVIELPPLSQPFELVFRGISYPPMDIIALTEINYSSTLCDNHNDHMREKWQSSPNLIGFHDWQHFRRSHHYQGQTMIIVSQPKIEEKNVDLQENNRQESFFEATNTSTAFSETNIPLPASISLLKTKTTTATSTMGARNATSEPFTTSLTHASTKDLFANITSLFRQTAPVLSYIPVLVKILQSAELWDPVGTEAPFKQPHFIHNDHAFGIKQELKRTPVPPTNLYQRQKPVEVAKNSNVPQRNNLITTISPIHFTSPVNASFLRNWRNMHGILMTTLGRESISTVYPPFLSRNMNFRKETNAKKMNAETQENKMLHRRLLQRNEKQRINTTSPTKASPHNELIVIKRPTNTESEVAMKLIELVKHLPLGDSNGRKLIQQIPEIDILTRDVDLTQVSKRGGIFKLHKQFLERLMRPTMSVQVDNTSTSLPTPNLSQRRPHKTLKNTKNERLIE